MRKRMMALALVMVLLTGCTPGKQRSRPFRYTDYTLFDTVTTVLGYGDSQEEFETRASALCAELLEYHRLFDIYEQYDGLVNLKTVNDRAGTAPVEVDPRILEFLEDCREYWELSEGRVNVAMGAVLQLWHQARTEALEHPDRAALPDPEALRAASEHCRMEDLILDPDRGTVFFADPLLRLDVGAAAKGWAVQQVCSRAPEGMLISVGGNVFATGPKPQGEPWIVGVQDPDGGEGYLERVPLTGGSAVTSGDYQRFFTVDGRNYHHIIDPDTLEPGTRWRSVTVLCQDSGMADCLSTALFLLPLEEGQVLLEKTGAQALWVDGEGRMIRSEGFPEGGK